MIIFKKNIEKLSKNLSNYEEIKGRSLWEDARIRFFKNKAASSCLILPHFKNLSFVTLIISREIIDKAKITKRE